MDRARIITCCKVAHARKVVDPARCCGRRCAGVGHSSDGKKKSSKAQQQRLRVVCGVVSVIHSRNRKRGYGKSSRTGMLRFLGPVVDSLVPFRAARRGEGISAAKRV